ncbi:hypothetical protein V1515DRAFT_601860 [Lipomyces mesembrius]
MSQRLWQLFLTLYAPKKGILPSAALPVLGMDDNTLMQAFFSRAVLDLKNFLIVLVPSCSRRKCLQQIIHGRVPDIVRSLQDPMHLQGLNRLLVDRPGPQLLLRFPNLLDFYGSQTFVICPTSRRKPITKDGLLLWRRIDFKLLCPQARLLRRLGRQFRYHRQPVIADIGSGRPPEAIAPAVTNRLRSTLVGLKWRRWQP